MLTLISGGARSGKSQLAVDLAIKSKREVIFCATAQALDEEMKQRIALHKKYRPTEWELIEEPKFLAERFKTLNTAKLLIIDCLTLYLTNLMGADWDDEQITLEINNMLAVIKERNQETIIVSNEVGQGIVPQNPLARRFCDLAGRINQDVAKAADSVFICFLGFPLQLK